MPSISDTLHIASQAIENALTASSTKKIDPTTHASGIHNHKKGIKKGVMKIEEGVIKNTDNEVVKHIDLHV
jgi:hypothetical protein